MKRILTQFACGLATLVAGFFCLNYTNGFGINHHTEWSAAHGFPAPSYMIFLAGVVLEILGAGICGHAIGRGNARKANSAPPQDR